MWLLYWGVSLRQFGLERPLSPVARQFAKERLPLREWMSCLKIEALFFTSIFKMNCQYDEDIFLRPSPRFSKSMLLFLLCYAWGERAPEPLRADLFDRGNSERFESSERVVNTDLFQGQCAGGSPKADQVQSMHIFWRLAAPSSCRSALHRAALDNDVEEVERRLMEGANIEDADKNGKTSLHLAAEKGHCEVVDRLLAAKAAVEALDRFRRTPLHWAARYGHTATVDRLLAAGAAVDARDNNGHTPLYYAAIGGHPETAQRLLAAGARADAQDEYGETPWDWAKRRGQETRMAPVLCPDLHG
ncbi:Ankyrin repeat domain-containing protein 23 (Diabetes-related ankyrin repeat protein) (Muscle ankyrin repeat protein 3) [Durusdinium trenchii]|uniref:Ankyrin repeat domain-containing protein 23 (Diabetes-related ankyrin repeat protein) (Muscle ankyrin repeat protein 3) n=1 Tax=Durusdinium trenchii TaxID=1381693 RepID=A0ABP0LW94_9DINO